MSKATINPIWAATNGPGGATPAGENDLTGCNGGVTLAADDAAAAAPNKPTNPVGAPDGPAGAAAGCPGRAVLSVAAAGGPVIPEAAVDADEADMPGADAAAVSASEFALVCAAATAAT